MLDAGMEDDDEGAPQNAEAVDLLAVDPAVGFRYSYHPHIRRFRHKEFYTR